MGVQQPEQLLATASAIMKEADYSFFMSNRESAEINARLMHPFEPDVDFNVWLGASPGSRKVREILKQNTVTLAFINQRSTAHIRVSGHVVAIR